MVKRISRSKARSRKVMLRAFLRWLLYAAVLLVFYVGECAPLIRGFCPLLILPLATAVAMHEGELAAGVFGVCCGLMLDMASGTLLGFSSLWLLMMCPMISLLARFWIKVNSFSHLLLNAGVCVVMGFMDFLFLHWVWEGEQSLISLNRVILPAYIGAIAFSIPIYFLVRGISRTFRIKEERNLEESANTAEESSERKI